MRRGAQQQQPFDGEFVARFARLSEHRGTDECWHWLGSFKARGERHHRARLTEEQARRAKFGGEPVAMLAREFGVHADPIRGIRNGYSWAWLKEDVPA